MSSQQKQVTPSHTKPVQQTQKQHSQQKSNGVVPPSTQKKIDPEVQSAKRKREQINNVFQSAKKEREAKLATDQQKQHSQKQLNSQQELVNNHLKEFLDFFVLVKYAVLYYTYGVLDVDEYHSSFDTFKDLLKKIPQEDTYDLESSMKHDNPLTIVTLDKEMMNFILNEMNNDFSSIRKFKNETLQKIYLKKNYKNLKEDSPGNKKILVTLKEYYNTFCDKNHIDIDDVSLQKKMEETMNKTTNLQDFGNIIAKYIVDHKNDKATRTPKPQTGPTTLNAHDNAKPPTRYTTSIKELKRQLHEMIERFMEMLHLHNKGKKNNLQ